MKKLILIITMMMLMLSFTVATEAAAKKPTSPPSQQISAVNDSVVGIAQPTNVIPTAAATTYSPAETSEPDEGSAHISPSLDRFINTYLIPMLVVVFGLFWRKVQKERLTKILFMGYNLWKEVDNMFASTPVINEYQAQIDAKGIFAVKKQKTVELINRNFSQPQLSLATKVAGNIPAFVELINTAFKVGSPLAGKLLKQIKKW